MNAAAYGTLEITEHHNPLPGYDGWHTRYTIDHADPRILVSHELLEMIGRGECEPYARLSKTCACSPGWCGPHYQGARLEIQDSYGRRLVYVIGEPDSDYWAWAAEWPD